MVRLARWCFRHRLRVLLGWLAVLGAVLAAGFTVGSAYTADYTLADTDSGVATNLLATEFPRQSGDTATIVWQPSTGSVHAPEVRERITTLLGELATVPHVVSVSGPYEANDPAAASRVSADGRTAKAEVAFDVRESDLSAADIQPIVDKIASARTDDLTVEAGGDVIALTEESPPGISEVIGLLAAGIVLLFAFGSLVAMTLPLITAVLSLGVGLGTIMLLSHTFGIAAQGPTLGTLVGLGVGIDYALFIVHRYRNGLRAGRDPEDAAINALNTSGRAVLFAGATVCVALLAILVLGIGFLNGLAVASAIMVVLSMLGSITLLPAMFGFYGTKVLGRRDIDSGPARSGRWAATVQRRPRVFAGVALALMVLLALPFFGMRLGTADAGNNPADHTTRQAYDLLSDGFGPGSNGPLLAIATLNSPNDVAAFTDFAREVRDVPGVAAVTPPVVNDANSAAMAQVIPTSAPQDERTGELIERIRSGTVASAEAGSTMDVHLGGSTAVFADFADTLGAAMPLFVVLIVVLGAVLLMLAFRSIVIPITAAVMNLLAAGAAFGVLTAVFQHGFGLDLLGGYAAGPIEPFVPMIMIAVLFGLSMDYQVFLVSSIQEQWHSRRDNAEAVRLGLADTGKVINAAAIIMICVFLAFVLMRERLLAEFGVGLATAVLLDAFVLRMMLVPAVMFLLGKANWWLPRWLDRKLPHLTIEPPETASPDGKRPTHAESTS